MTLHNIARSRIYGEIKMRHVANVLHFYGAYACKACNIKLFQQSLLFILDKYHII